MELKSIDEGFVEGGVAEEGENVLKQNAWSGKVGKLAQRLVESYLKTGELGGGGGLTGGLSWGFRGIWTVGGWM